MSGRGAVRRERRRRRGRGIVLVLLLAVLATLLVTVWLAVREPPVPPRPAAGTAGGLRG